MKSRIILCGLTLALAGVAQAGYTPIAIQSSSYNADLVVESNAFPTLKLVTSASIDNGTNNTANTWFEQGFDQANPQNGLPPHGSTFTALQAADHSFTMAPSYTAPNGILVNNLGAGGAFALVSPAAYTKLSFLGNGGDGGDEINVVVQHADGTSETGSYGCPDWFGNPGVAYIANGRCNSTVNLTTETDGGSGDGLGNPRIYYRDITLANTTSPVTNLVFSYISGSSGANCDIMGVSGALTSGGSAAPFTPITVTGYNYDFVVESNAAAPGRILSQTMMGGTNLWATTQTLDNTNNTGNVWYEMGYNINNSDSGSFNNISANLTGTGIPPAGSFLTNATGDHIYQMPPDYTVNNAVYISDFDANTNATITLTTPAAYSGLSFLGSAGNGPVGVNYVITHTGGKTETGVLVINDWFDGSSPYAYIANGRVAADTAEYGGVNNGDPILQESDIVLSDAVDPVVSIYLENTNGFDQGLSSGRFGILAVSGSAGAVPPVFTVVPQSTNNYVGTSVTLTGAATANAAITYQWQIETNGAYVNLANGGNISGVTTTTLSINPIGFSSAGNYQLVATDSAGSEDSATATLGVFSSATDVTEPGDPISVGPNVSPFGDGSPNYAIDDSMDTKFGANYSGAFPYLVVTPSAGRTVLSGIRIYTGSDTTSRDPASFMIEGSLNGGATYTLITSNAIALSNNRNPLTAGEAPDPLTQWCTEVDFANANGYTTYRVSFPTQKGSGQIQFDEMELLGVIDTSKPFFSTQPVSVPAYAGTPPGIYGSDSASFTAVATFTPTPTLSWFKGTNGIYIPLADGNNISGSQTTTLMINPTTFADSADYVAVANSTAGYVTSAVAHLSIYSTNVDVTQPGDPTTDIGDTTGTRYGANALPAAAIDDQFTEWENGGSGLNAGAGFPPFGGPVGFTVTPAVGSTVLAGIRFYPGQDSSANDPSSYILEGSNDGGTTYVTISSGPLALPGARNSINGAVDPCYQDPVAPYEYASVEEILFSNVRGFTTYRLTFPNVVSPNAASYLEVGEIELLGVPGVGSFQPVIGQAIFSAGNLSISGTGGTPSASFMVQTNANLSNPAGWNTASTGTYDSSGNFSARLPVSAATPVLFYRIQ
jgi:hypothetical protein